MLMAPCRSTSPRQPPVLALVLTVAALGMADTPEISFIARWGGVSKDIPSAIVATDADVFVVGSTYSHDFPTTVGRPATGEWCAFATRLIAKSGAVAYSTAACGKGMMWGRAAAVSAAAELWTVGSTDGPGLPVTRDAAQRHFGGGSATGAGDAFVLRWSRDGSSIAYATYLGASGDEQGSAALSDPAGGVWVGGSTDSREFGAPVPASASPDRGGVDGFIARIDAEGRLAFAHRVGGTGSDDVVAMAQIKTDRIAVIGQTTSHNARGGGTPRRDIDGFVALFDTRGRATVWSRQLGGSADDRLLGAAVLPDGRIVAVGDSASSSCRTGMGQDGWVVVLSDEGVPLRNFCLGGRDNEAIRGVTVDVAGDIWITGVTSSPDFPRLPQQAGMRPLSTYRQAYVAKLDIDRGALRSARLLGTDEHPRNQYAEGRGLVAVGDHILIAGDIGGSQGGRVIARGGQVLPTPGAYGERWRAGSQDAYVVSLRRWP